MIWIVQSCLEAVKGDVLAVLECWSLLLRDSSDAYRGKREASRRDRDWAAPRRHDTEDFHWP